MVLLCCTSCRWTEPSAYVQVGDRDIPQLRHSRVSIRLQGFITEQADDLVGT